MTGDLRAMARALGGEIVGGQVSCPGPGHSPRDRSLAVRLSADAPMGFIAFSHCGDDWTLCRDDVARRLGFERDAWKRDRRLSQGLSRRQSTTPTKSGRRSDTGMRASTRAERS
jgi:putative DNA primase/helicase